MAAAKSIMSMRQWAHMEAWDYHRVSIKNYIYIYIYCIYCVSTSYIYIVYICITNGPRSVSCDPAIRYSGFFGVREKWVLLEISWSVEVVFFVEVLGGEG